MRNLTEYHLFDWLTLKPVKWGLKELRNRALLNCYLKKSIGAAKQARLEIDKKLTPNGELFVIVAFEKFELVEILLEEIRVKISSVPILVADNSYSLMSQKMIKDVCDVNGAVYLNLPEYKTRHNARSHSFACQWVYKNVVKQSNVKKFGFIDHDLVPIKSFNPFDRLNGNPCYGSKREGVFKNGAWQLWTGYAFFDLQDDLAQDLNFLYDFANGLDAGGMNFWKIYRHINQNYMSYSDQRLVTVETNYDDMTMEFFDNSWVHLGGAGYLNNFDERLIAFKEVIKILTNEGISDSRVSLKECESVSGYFGYFENNAD